MNPRYLNMFRVYCVALQQLWANNWLYFVHHTWALVFRACPSQHHIIWFCCLLMVSSFSIALSVFTKITFFIKRGVGFQVLGCIFATSFVLHCQSLPCGFFLVSCPVSVDRHPRVLWKRWVQTLCHCTDHCEGWDLYHMKWEHCISGAMKPNFHYFSIFYGHSHAVKMSGVKMLAAEMSIARVPT